MILSRFAYDTMKLDFLIDALKPQKVIGLHHDHMIKGLTYDSRLVMPGYVFVALPGMKDDGARYIDEAVQRGALAVIAQCEVPVPRSVTFMLVGNARKALAEVASVFHRFPSTTMETFGITGTNGKTTVSYLIKAILENEGRVPGLIGTVEHLIRDRVIPASRTTPESPELQAMMDQMVECGCSSVVMEVSSHALDQYRVHCIEYDVAVFTNLSQDHLDYHETMEQYFQAKSRLFSQLKKDKGVAVINLDDTYGRQLVADLPLSGVVTYGESVDAMVRAKNVLLDEDGIRFTLVSPWGEMPVSLPLFGRFNVSNALAAIAAAGVAEIELERVVDVLESVEAPPGRLERVPSPVGQVFVDYAHTHHALENVIQTLRETTRGKIYVVFGCGGDRDRSKRALMAKAVEQFADVAIVTTDNPRSETPADIIADVLLGFSAEAKPLVHVDREEAIAAGVRLLTEEDVLLIAGKGHENYMEFSNTVVPFDDREVAARVIADQP